MGGTFQVQHNYARTQNTRDWVFYTVGPLHGEGWLCAVAMGYRAYANWLGGFSLTLVGQPEGSEANHASGVNLLGPGGSELAMIGDIRSRTFQLSYYHDFQDIMPMWVFLQGGSHWVSVAFQGTSITAETASWCWAAVVSKGFINGLVGNAVSAAAMPAGGRR